MNILIVTGGYLPGYKYGGPIRSIHALVEQLGEQVSFSIVTAAHDLGETQPYSGIPVDTWIPHGNAMVYYTLDPRRSLTFWRRIIDETKPDIIYLNSFFAGETRSLLLWRRLGLLPKLPVVLAPRGEFSSGALSLKSKKKQVYLSLSAKFGLYEGIVWHATKPQEKEDIYTTIGAEAHIEIAAPSAFVPKSQITTGLEKAPGVARFVFVSRIVPMKNLLAAISAIKSVNNGALFHIYGPIEDESYWQECLQEIRSQGLHDVVTYQGELTHEQVMAILPHYHFFLLPSLGENFGHVIAEALNHGLPVLVSDQTPWRELEIAEVGWDIPLDETDRWRHAINRCVGMTNDEYQAMSVRCRTYVNNWLEVNGSAKSNLNLFQTAVR